MVSSRVVTQGLLLLGIILWLPSVASPQAAVWTKAACSARMEELFKMAQDPKIALSRITDEIGDKARTQFALNCRLQEANSIAILQHRLENIEADRQETASAANRTDKAGINFKAQSSAYNPGGMNFGGGMGF